MRAVLPLRDCDIAAGSESKAASTQAGLCESPQRLALDVPVAIKVEWNSLQISWRTHVVQIIKPVGLYSS